MCGRKRESEQGEAGGHKVREERRERLCGGGESACERARLTDRRRSEKRFACQVVIGLSRVQPCILLSCSAHSAIVCACRHAGDYYYSLN